MRARPLAITNTKYSVTEESFDSISTYWLDPRYPLRWDCVFVLPTWLKVWWDEFGAGLDLALYAIKQREQVIGIAPLLVREGKASIIGSADVCDYLDFVVTPGREQGFFGALIDHLCAQGVTHLDLRSLRPDSMALTVLAGIAQNRGCKVSCGSEDVALELDLPATWEDYLLMLDGKQRHETKRKLRRLHEAARINYRVVENREAVKSQMSTFFTLFTRNREDKAAFMTERMTSFFNSLAEAMAEANILRLSILEVDAMPAAAVMCFDYRSTIYLYNSAYDRQFSSLSVGLLSKVLSIKESIQRGRKKYDFMKGSEPYKHRLGGKEVPLYKCQIRFK
jgi:CelD/BcsL family acetyltransferase involved in cellulose biosynthesis